MAQLSSGRGYVRFQSEANVYANALLTIIVLVYVDDHMAVCPESNAQGFRSDLSASSSLSLVGNLVFSFVRKNQFRFKVQTRTSVTSS